MNSSRLEAFAGVGIELEYMIVDDDDLSARPVADRLLSGVAGPEADEVQRGTMGWSNELVAHVVEIKNQRPAAELGRLTKPFQTEVRAINRELRGYRARLMPTAMHPWFDPRSETRVWPHDPHGIYGNYARIFDTKTHGWANLQSMHINLPFADDAQFARLHAAIRLVLPIIPALAASSPLADGRDSGFADYRMQAYRHNADGFPSIAGRVIPETVSSRTEYEERILRPMYRAIAPHDPDGALQFEWLNSRGAIARFDRHAIEIRVTDTQECPKADLAIAAAVISTVYGLYQEQAAPLHEQQAFADERLVAVFDACVRSAEAARIDDARYLALFGYPGASASAQDLWRHLVRQMPHSSALPAQPWLQPLEWILEHGSLASRIRRALGGDHSRARLQAVYRQLCDCLQEGAMFAGMPPEAGQ